jgi:two-component system response regulator
MNQSIERNKKTILLVEDNPTDELLTVQAIEESDIPTTVAVARDGAEALDYLFAKGKYAERDINDLPCFVLLDLKLPKLDGLKVLKKIRSDKKTSLLPVIILTSSKEEQDMVESYKLGANSYVQKPVDFEQFMEVAQKLGFYWFHVNQLPRYDIKTSSRG